MSRQTRTRPQRRCAAPRTRNETSAGVRRGGGGRSGGGRHTSPGLVDWPSSRSKSLPKPSAGGLSGPPNGEADGAARGAAPASPSSTEIIEPTSAFVENGGGIVVTAVFSAQRFLRSITSQLGQTVCQSHVTAWRWLPPWLSVGSNERLASVGHGRGHHHGPLVRAQKSITSAQQKGPQHGPQSPREHPGEGPRPERSYWLLR